MEIIQRYKDDEEEVQILKIEFEIFFEVELDKKVERFIIKFDK